jgi:hypothetical protein
MRSSGVRGLLIYCADYHCSIAATRSRSAQTNGPTTFGLSDLEARFVGKACGNKGADIWPDFNWNKAPRRVRPLHSPLRDQRL